MDFTEDRVGFLNSGHRQVFIEQEKAVTAVVSTTLEWAGIGGILIAQNRHYMWAEDIQSNNDCNEACGESCSRSHVFGTTNHGMLFRVKHINCGFKCGI
jgi:hypothetical protein